MDQTEYQRRKAQLTDEWQAAARQISDYRAVGVVPPLDLVKRLNNTEWLLCNLEALRLLHSDLKLN